MTDGASTFMNYLKSEYQKEGFPNPRAWAFSADDDDQKRAFLELRSKQLIREVAEGKWMLTDRGLAWILEQLPSSPEANRIWSKLKAAYAAAGRPKRRTFAFVPEAPAEEAAYNELRARGYIEQLNNEKFILSASGMNQSFG